MAFPSFTLLALVATFALSLSAPAPAPAGIVFSVKPQSHRLSPEASAALNKHRSATNPIYKQLLEHKDPVIKDATGTGTLQLQDFQFEALIGNLTIGTPAQNFSVLYDIWSSDLSVVDVSAVYDTEYCNSDSGCSDENTALAAKTMYNASASSTATTSSKKFRGSLEPGDKGTITKDTINLGGLSLSAFSFGDLTQVGQWLDYLPVDGSVGISAAKSSNKINNVLNQMVGSLASPVMTIHVNRSINDGSTDAEIMFGSNALPQCNAANWVTVSMMPKPQYALGAANATSFTIAAPGVDGPCNNAVIQTSHPLLIVDFYTMIRVSVQAMEVFKKASGAVFDSSRGWYTVDCTQINTLPGVTVGFADGSNITIGAKDYVLDLSQTSYKACFLFVKGAYDEGVMDNQAYGVALGQSFLNNHCISYDINANTMAFTDALPNNGH